MENKLSWVLFLRSQVKKVFQLRMSFFIWKCGSYSSFFSTKKYFFIKEILYPFNPSIHIYFLFIEFYFIYSRFLLVIHFIHISVYMSNPVSQFIPPPPPAPPHFPLLVPIRLFSTPVFLFLPSKPVHLYHFSIFHIYALIYDICISLLDLLHSVWQSLDPSTSQQMTQFCSFLWLSNIPLYICTTSLSIHLSMVI